MRWRWEYDCDAHMRVTLDRECGDTYDAEKVCRQRLWRTASASIRRMFVAELVELALFHGRRDLLPESDAWTIELVGDGCERRAPPLWKVYRGAVLVELGRLEDALPFLHEVTEDEAACGGVLAVHYLAKLHHDRGDTALAREWQKVADARRPVIHPGRLAMEVDFIREESER